MDIYGVLSTRQRRQQDTTSVHPWQSRDGVRCPGWLVGPPVTARAPAAVSITCGVIGPQGSLKQYHISPGSNQISDRITPPNLHSKHDAFDLVKTAAALSSSRSTQQHRKSVSTHIIMNITKTSGFLDTGHLVLVHTVLTRLLCSVQLDPSQRDQHQT